MAEALSSPPAGAGRFRGFVRDIVVFAGWRLAGLGALTVLAVAAEGAGLLLLVPLLGLMGVTASAGSAAVAAGGAVVGLEAALVVYVVLVAAAAAVVQARGVAVSQLRAGYIDHLRERLHTALMAMEWGAFVRLRGADVTHVLTGESGRAANGVEFFLRLAGWAVEVPVLLLVATRLSPLMTGVGLAAGLAVALLLRPLNRRTFALGQAAGAAARQLQADLADDLAAMRVIRSHGLEAARRAGFGRGIRTLRERQMAFQGTAAAARAVLQMAAAAAAALAVVVAVRGFGLALADTLVLVAVFARLMGAAMRIQDGWRSVLHALPAHAAVGDLLARLRAAAEPEPLPGAVAPPLSDAIRLQGVSYRYAGGGGPALRDVDLTIPARAVTAVVGPSGAGKSTLADLLLGLSAPDGGCILIDGQPLDGPARHAWRQRVGYVPQDSVLFHASVRYNLALGNPALDEPALWAALEMVAAADVVRALPQGIDTVVGDRGATLSGGERQRLALARALLRQPDLLILDEATSALDAASERRVLQSLETLRGRLTLVVVAHRASTVRGADRVAVLDGGAVAAAGTWEEVERTAGPLLARLHLTA